MKQLIAIAGLGLALTGCMTDYGWSEAPLDDRHYVAGAPVDWWGRDVGSVDVFYGSLGRYGNWGNHARYGRVFLPTGVGPGWQPYSRGYWRNDPRFGRVFVSSDPWGWATYHYGRWGRDPGFGWFWVPDTRFGPNWVDWQSAGGFASWSPLPPPGWSRWGYGWGNDWWIHAPGAWAYRPGMYDHVRRGRWDGRRDWDRDRDRDRHDRDRDRDPDWVDRTRPGEPPVAGFVRNRVPPPQPQGQPASALPSDMWAAPRRAPRGPDGQRNEAPRGEAMRGDAGSGGAMGGFVRNRTQPGGAPGFARAPGDARPQPERVVAAPPARVMAAPPERVMAAPPPERPSYQRTERPQPSYQRAPDAPRGREPQGRDVPQRVADD